MAKQDVHPLRDKYHKALRAQRFATHNYWANAAFIRGDQWVHVNPVTKRLEEVPEEPERIRATFNRLWPGSRTIISKLTQRHLQFDVAPNSADDVAIEGAKLGESILVAVSAEHMWENIREAVSWAAWKGGTAAVCVDWDPSKGKPTALMEDGRLLPSGDTVETPLSIAEFAIQPGVREAETAYWWIKAQALPPEVVKNQYGLSKEPAADVTLGLSPLESKLMSAHASGANGPQDKINDTPLTLVLTYYERPNPSRPEGRIEVVIGNETVQGPMKWPFPFVDYLNIATTRETMIENTWMGETVVTIARPLQASYNFAWSNILQHSDTVGNAKLLMPQSAVDLENEITNQPNNVLRFIDGLGQPKYLEAPQLAQYISQMPDEIRREIDDQLGVHDVSRGQAPANIESGYGLAVLAEQDATPIGKMAKSQAEMWGRVASMVLKIYEAEVTEFRTAVVKLPGYPPETTEWTGKNLAGQTTANVPLDLVLPRSRAAMMQTADKMLQQGLISTMEEYTRVAELPGERQMIEAVRPDVARARRENHSMALGGVPMPEDYDDDEIHIHEHNTFRKTARYEQLDPELRKAFAAHVQAHETRMAEKAGEEARRAQALEGAMGGGAPQEELPDDGIPPVEEQTVMDQLTGDTVAAQARLDAEEDAEAAGVIQNDLARDEMLALADITQGGG